MFGSWVPRCGGPTSRLTSLLGPATKNALRGREGEGGEVVKKKKKAFYWSSLFQKLEKEEQKVSARDQKQLHTRPSDLLFFLI